MKSIKLTVPASSTSEMNNLVDAVCKIVAEEDSARLRDKFKMVDMASPSKIMDLCVHLKVDVEFVNSGKVAEVVVRLKVKNSFKFEDIEPKTEKPVKKETPVVPIDTETKEETTEVHEETESTPDLAEATNENEENFESVATKETQDEVANTPSKDLTSTETSDDDSDFPF